MSDDQTHSNPYQAPTTCPAEEAAHRDGRQQNGRRFRWRVIPVTLAYPFGVISLLGGLGTVAMSTWQLLGLDQVDAHALALIVPFYVTGLLCVLAGIALIVAARCLWKGRWLWGWH